MNNANVNVDINKLIKQIKPEYIKEFQDIMPKLKSKDKLVRGQAMNKFIILLSKVKKSIPAKEKK